MIGMASQTMSFAISIVLGIVSVALFLTSLTLGKLHQSALSIAPSIMHFGAHVRIYVHVCASTLVYIVHCWQIQYNMYNVYIRTYDQYTVYIVHIACITYVFCTVEVPIRTLRVYLDLFL